MRHSLPVATVALGAAVLSTGCARRGVASGPTTVPGAWTWALVGLATGLAIVVVGALLVRMQDPVSGGDPVATVVLAVHAGAALVGGAMLAGLAVRSWSLADAKAAGHPASETSLLRVSVTDGDPRFYTLMLVMVLLLTGSLVFLLSVAGRFARRDDPRERAAACAVLALELIAATFALALVVQGRHEWPFVLAALHVPIFTIAIATCWPRVETRYNGRHG